MKTKEQIIDEILDRGIIVDILPSRAEFKKKLLKTALFYRCRPDKYIVTPVACQELYVIGRIQKTGTRSLCIVR